MQSRSIAKMNLTVGSVCLCLITVFFGCIIVQADQSSLTGKYADLFGTSNFLGYGRVSQREAKGVENAEDAWPSPLPDYLVKSMAAASQREQRSSSGRPVSEQLIIPVAVSSNDLRSVPAKNNYKLTVSCRENDMHVRVEFERPFHGVIYSKGFFQKPECVFVSGDNKTSIFEFLVNYNSCGSYNRKTPLPTSTPGATTSATTPSATSTTTTSTTTTTASPITAPPTIINPRRVDGVSRTAWPAPTVASPVRSVNSADTGSYAPTNAPSTPLVYRQPQQFAPQPNNPFQQPYIVAGGQQQQYPSNLLPTGLLGGYNQPMAPVYGQGGYPVQQTLYPQNMLTNGVYGGYPVAQYGRLGRELDDDAVDMTWVENTLIIQQDNAVQDSMDDAKSLQCEWREKYNKKIVTEGYKVEMADVVHASFPGDNVGTFMQIKSGLGPLSSDAQGVIKIGSPLTLVVGLTNSSGKFDLLVHSCYAKGQTSTPPIPLVDEHGCVVRDKYLGPFIPYSGWSSQFGDNKVVFAYFQAFKFPDSTEVDIECSVTICRNSCPAQCFGRYKNEQGHYISNWTMTTPKKSIAPPVEKNDRSDEFIKPTFSQGRIMEVLERRLKQANHPQQHEDVQVKSGSPFLVNPPRFLQPRDLTNDNDTDKFPSPSSANTTTPTTPHLQKVKRQVARDSSNVGLRRKLTVVDPSGDSGTTNAEFLLTAPEESTPSTTTTTNPVIPSTTQIPLIAHTDLIRLSTTESSTVTTTPAVENHPTVVIPKSTTTTPPSDFLSETSSTTTDQTDVVVVQPASLILSSISPTTKSPIKPFKYALQDINRDICLPLVGFIGVAVLAGSVLIAALICGSCMCWKYHREVKAKRQTFSLPIYSDPRPVATPVSRRLLTDI